MFQIRRRWSVLTAVLVVGAYVLNNYSIEGLEKLKVKPRSPGELAQHPATSDSWSTDIWQGLDKFKSPNELSSSPLVPSLPKNEIPPRNTSLPPRSLATQRQPVSNWRGGSGTIAERRRKVGAVGR